MRRHAFHEACLDSRALHMSLDRRLKEMMTTHTSRPRTDRHPIRRKQPLPTRFPPISENDEILLPEQIASIKVQLRGVKTDVIQLQEPRIDAMLPARAMLIPHLMAEFNENPNLAMIHGKGTAHAWIDVNKLREVLASKGDMITNYRSLFRAFTARGYDVKKIKYISFESALRG